MCTARLFVVLHGGLRLGRLLLVGRDGERHLDAGALVLAAGGLSPARDDLGGGHIGSLLLLSWKLFGCLDKELSAVRDGHSRFAKTVVQPDVRFHLVRVGEYHV